MITLTKAQQAVLDWCCQEGGAAWIANVCNVFGDDAAAAMLTEKLAENQAAYAAATDQRPASVRNAPPAPTAEQLAAAAYTAAMGAGCQIVSTSTPALNGTYALDAQSIADVMSEVQFIGAFSEFSNGATTLVWPVAGGAVTFPSTAAAMSVFKAIAQYVTAWKQYAAGVTSAAPTQPVTIA